MPLVLLPPSPRVGLLAPLVLPVAGPRRAAGLRRLLLLPSRLLLVVLRVLLQLLVVLRVFLLLRVLLVRLHHCLELQLPL